MLLDYVTAADGRVGDLLAADAETYGEPSLFARAVGNNPDVLAARMDYVDALRDAGSVDDRLVELAYATVALANDCDYCVASHTTQLVEHVGVEDHEVEILVDAVGDADDHERSDQLVESFDERERAVVGFAHAAAADPKRVSSDDVERLHAVGFDDAAIVQLLALVSAAVAANTVADTLNILPADRPGENTGSDERRF